MNQRHRYKFALFTVWLSLGVGCDEDDTPTDALPCDVNTVVEQHCAGCHGAVPKFGAPGSLVSTSDWLAPSLADPTETIWHIAKERMHYDQESAGLAVQHAGFGPMPPAPNRRLNASELAIMDTWIEAGLPGRRSGVQCTKAGYEGPGLSDAFDCDEIGGKTIEFVAHADRERDVPFPVGEAKDAYYNFGFRAPWTSNVYAKSIVPVIDNVKVIHHYLLFKNDSTAYGHLRVAPSSGAHIFGQLVEGWAPGGPPKYYGEKVGRVLEPGMYNLEVHYNSDDPDAEDMSGLSICYVEEEPDHIAELVWVGTDESTPSKVWTGNCDPRGPFPIHILSVTPHMHEAGRWMKAVINRADGRKEILHDAAFSFDNQTTYNFPQDVLLWEGDTITTTCTFATEKRFGKDTSDEMCYLYPVSWPAGALRSFGGLVHGPNTCMDELVP